MMDAPRATAKAEQPAPAVARPSLQGEQIRKLMAEQNTSLFNPNTTVATHYASSFTPTLTPSAGSTVVVNAANLTSSGGR